MVADLFFPQFYESDMSRSAYLEIIQRVLGLRDNESRLYFLSRSNTHYNGALQIDLSKYVTRICIRLLLDLKISNEIVAYDSIHFPLFIYLFIYVFFFFFRENYGLSLYVNCLLCRGKSGKKSV